MPSMTITIQLPIATIIEIRRQGNGLDEVLRTLCLSPSSTSRLVHDIVRNVTRVANALPTTVLSTNNTIKAIAVAGMTKFATMVCSPEDDVFAQRASIPAKPPTTPISFIIEEPSGKLESFRMLSRTTLREVANMYQERTGIQVTGVTFDCTSGSVTYGSGLDSKTLYQVLLWLANPSLLQLIGTSLMSVRVTKFWRTEDYTQKSMSISVTWPSMKFEWTAPRLSASGSF